MHFFHCFFFSFFLWLVSGALLCITPHYISFTWPNVCRGVCVIVVFPLLGTPSSYTASFGPATKNYNSPRRSIYLCVHFIIWLSFKFNWMRSDIRINKNNTHLMAWRHSAKKIFQSSRIPFHAIRVSLLRTISRSSSFYLSCIQFRRCRLIPKWFMMITKFISIRHFMRR